ncbi:colanic acid biosynthesis glycosyltransferase WcaC, partial [Clavibacter michiganensis subsp. insidiosus]
GRELAAALLADERAGGRADRQTRDVRRFDPRRMADEYRAVYEELVSA